MKIIYILGLILIVFILVSCSTEKECERLQAKLITKGCIKVQNSDTVIIHDSVIQTIVSHDIEPDTSLLQALIECNANGEAKIKEITSNKNGSHVHSDVHIKNNVISVSCVVDSFAVYTIMTKRMKETNSSSIETKTLAPVKYIPKIYKWAFWFSLFVIVVGVGRYLLKYLKKEIIA